MLPFFHALEDYLKKARDTYGLRPAGFPLLLLGLVLIFNLFIFSPHTVTAGISLAMFLSPLWIPAMLASAAWFVWITLKRSEFIARQKYVLLEIKPPRTLEKTPLAMETVLAGLHHTKGESNWYQKYVQGQVRPYWSLELVSLEGKVHFFLWTRVYFRKLVEAAIYAQYPGAQVIEVEDYTRTIAATPDKWIVWGCDYKATRPDPFPIKTYVEYGLDKVQEESEQVDPLSNLIEFLSSIGKGEYLWVQIVIRIHAGTDKYHGKVNADGKPYTWKDEAIEEIEKIRKRAGTKSKFFDPTTGKMVQTEGFPNPTKGQSEAIAAIERNISKLAFDVGIRSMYLAKKENFDQVNITGIISLFKAFYSEGWNGIKPTRWMMEYSDYPWELGNTNRKEIRAQHLLDAYRRRQHYHEPYAFDDYMTMSTEEIATLYHIPSKAVASPALPRIESATGEAPPNLPT